MKKKIKRKSLIKEEEKLRLLFFVKQESTQPRVTVVREKKQTKNQRQ